MGAICINVDINYLQEKVLSDMRYVEKFFTEFCKTEMKLNENILSKQEYKLALDGKRHWQDRAV